MLIQLVFYSFATVLVFAAFMVITVRNPVQAALFLVLAFFCSSAIWLLLEAEFLAIALVLVYVGAVMVLFLFVVMMLDINITAVKEGFIRYLPVGGLVAVVTMVTLVITVGPQNFGLEQFSAPKRHTANYSNIEELGAVLYTDYLYPFELAAVILLVAIIAAITLTLRPKRKTKGQSIEKQVAASPKDRVRIANINPPQMGKGPSA